MIGGARGGARLDRDCHRLSRKRPGWVPVSLPRLECHRTGAELARAIGAAAADRPGGVVQQRRHLEQQYFSNRLGGRAGPGRVDRLLHADGRLCAGRHLLARLLRIPARAAPRAVVPIPRRATLASLLAGVRFVWRTRIILATISLDLFAVLLGGAVFLIPAYAKEILHVGPVGFGWLRAAPAIGAFVMAIVLAHLPPMKRAGANMLWAVAGFGAATIVFGLSHSFALSFLMLAATGGFDNISVVVRHTLVQMLPPENMRGRVSAVNNIFIGASNEIGGLESGLTGWLLGPMVSVVAGGVGTLIVVALVALLAPQVRQFGSLADARPMDSDDEPRGFEVISYPKVIPPP